MRENHTAFQRIWFRPRILINVEKVDFSTTMLGTPVSIPFYVTATALGKLGHPEGEVVLTKAAHKHNVIQMIPTLASCSFDEIMDAAGPGQVQWFQLYVNKDREITKRIVQHAEARGCKGLFITVDAPQLGRREKDMRMKFTEEGSNVQKGQATDTSQGAARAISSFIDPSLSWADIPWFQSITKMPIVLKGVQRDGRLHVAGRVTLATQDADIRARFAGVDLVALQPYLIKVSETGVRRGTLDLRLDAKVKDQRLRAPGHLTLSDLQLHSSGVLGTFAGVPRQAVIAAMSRNGRLELDFTLEGRLDDPKFSLNENLAVQVASGLARSLGVSVGGVVEGVGNMVKGLFGR